MTMPPEDIPRRQERLILAESTYLFFGIYAQRFFPAADHMATFIEALHLMRVLWASTCRGEALTADQVGRAIGMPRETARRKLQYLVQKGYVERDGTKYAVSADTLKTVRPEIDDLIAIICDAADALRGARDP